MTVRFEGLWPDSISYELRGLWPEGDEDGFTYTASGIKDCSRCTRMHEGETGAAVVKELFPLLAELARAEGEVRP